MLGSTPAAEQEAVEASCGSNRAGELWKHSCCVSPHAGEHSLEEHWCWGALLLWSNRWGSTRAVAVPAPVRLQQPWDD